MPSSSTPRHTWPAPLLVPAILLVASLAAAAPDPFPGVAAAYLVRSDGATLWSHESGRRLAPASLTKMMTVLLAVEQGGLDRVTTVSAGAARETGTRLGLRRGERMRLRDLLAATLLGSANDAAHALAEAIGGSEAAFVARMNERAAQLGMRGTRFVNATGHHHPQHYATAEDLAILGEMVMKDPLIASLAVTVEMCIATVDRSRTFRFENKNELIGRYRGAIGVKTGFTEKAGPCLVAVAERKGRRVLLVLLNAPDRWWQAEAMLDRAFAEERRTAAAGRP